MTPVLVWTVGCVWPRPARRRGVEWDPASLQDTLIIRINAHDPAVCPGMRVRILLTGNRSRASRAEAFTGLSAIQPAQFTWYRNTGQSSACRGKSPKIRRNRLRRQPQQLGPVLRPGKAGMRSDPAVGKLRPVFVRGTMSVAGMRLDVIPRQVLRRIQFGVIGGPVKRFNNGDFRRRCVHALPVAVKRCP